MVRTVRALVLALGVLLPSLSHAAPFDFIYADQITMRAPLASWGITLAGLDFGLVVNTGLANLTANDLYAAEFTVDGVPQWPDTTNPVIDPWLRPGFNSGYLFHPSFQPIAPHEAVGSVPTPPSVLTALVAPGETFRNSYPAQFVYFEMGGTGNAPGVVRFDVHLRIGDERADFPIFVTLIDDPSYLITFEHAARVSGVPLAVATRPTTWGKLKSLYR